MAKVKYKPADGEADQTSQFGYDFKGGKAVEVEDPAHLAKFRSNRFFEVSESKAEAKEAEKVSEQPQQSTVVVPKTNTTSELHAVERGDGQYSIMQGAAEIRSGMSKEDADKFNKLSPEKRGEFVSK